MAVGESPSRIAWRWMRRCVNGLIHKGQARKHSAAALGWAENLRRSRHPAGNGDVASIPCQKSAAPWLTATVTNQDEPKNGEAWFVSLGRQNSTLTLTMRFQRRKCATLDAHLRSCHFCSADALARVQMKRAIQVAGKRFTPLLSSTDGCGTALHPNRSA